MADDKASGGLPTREAILSFLKRERESGQSTGKIGKREIARAFSIKGADRIALKRILKELEAEGAIERRRKILHRPGTLPAVVLADITTRDRNGDFLAVPVEWDPEHGTVPKILLMPNRQRAGAATPGIGDRALIRTELLTDAAPNEPAYSGRVIKLLQRARTQVLGIYRSDPRGGGRVLPIDKKNVGRGELSVPEGSEGGAREGDLVAVDVLRSGRLGLPTAKVRERLGSLATEKAMSLIALHSHGIPNVFRPETIAEAEHVRPASVAEREDWRAIPFVTIDPPDAKDHDDAVFAAPDPDPANHGGHIIHVAIADVAAYVRPRSALDREALDRGNSVYFPDRVVPMLPERISNDLCSLKADQDRPALAIRIIVAADGKKLSHRVHRVMIRSVGKLTYAQVQAAWDGMPGIETQALLEAVLQPLFSAYESLKAARINRAPLDLDLPERKILLKDDGTVDRVIVPPRLEAHRLIEEFMILANVAAAEALEAARQPLIYRAHDEPSLEKLNALSEFLASIDIKLAKGQVLTPHQFNGILARVSGTEHENIVNEIVLRTQAQAEYVTENYGHFGLHLRSYAHFTSPIRRYADLVVHRALIRGLGLGSDGQPNMDDGELAEIAARISAAERRAMAAERETIERLIAAHLSAQVGTIFEGRISGVTKVGIFVKLRDTGADGFVPAATLGKDYYHYDESLHALVSSRSGEMHRLGDEVTVKLVEAAPFAGALRFELLSEGKRAPRGSLDRAKSKRASRRDNGPAGGAASSRINRSGRR
ncbi:ribonuclease R [Methylovirgula sp. HY1]|uniref:ribonuclease R n=1 Tax=Methylovirgula sp. HY1 TaxID=2822761 RepID=UPI002106D48C|nr:ribonuclease R [Methylovirgula sp. HY1]